MATTQRAHTHTHTCAPAKAGQVHAALTQGNGSQRICPCSCPQVMLGLPQKLEEVLVVVGGRALEEDEEGGEEPTPHSGNFAFYNAKAREYLSPHPFWWPLCHLAGTQGTRHLPKSRCRECLSGLARGCKGAQAIARAMDTFSPLSLQPEPQLWSLSGPGSG